MKLLKSKNKTETKKKTFEKLNADQMKQVNGGADDANKDANKGAGLMLTIPFGR